MILGTVHRAGAVKRVRFFVYFLKTQGPEEACIFLQDNRCRIHTVNPRACRIYPLVVDPKENGRYEYLVSYERKQHFKGPKVHVKTWMKNGLVKKTVLS